MNSFIPSSWILIIQNSFRHSYPGSLHTMYVRSKKDKCNSKKTYNRYFWGPQFSSWTSQKWDYAGLQLWSSSYLLENWSRDANARCFTFDPARILSTINCSNWIKSVFWSESVFFQFESGPKVFLLTIFPFWIEWHGISNVLQCSWLSSSNLIPLYLITLENNHQFFNNLILSDLNIQLIWFNWYFGLVLHLMFWFGKIIGKVRC